MLVLTFPGNKLLQQCCRKVKQMLGENELDN